VRASPPAPGNAVRVLIAALPKDALRARLEREQLRRTDRLASRYDLDLAGFLNGAATAELRALAGACGLPPTGTPGLLRQRLWAWGAALERRALGIDAPRAEVQPPAVLVRGVLQVARAVRPTRAATGVSLSARLARFPPAASWPRPVPPAPSGPLVPPDDPPASLDALLARADALLGVRLGTRGRDKGQHGARISALLGIPRSSDASPDWRGEVEIKTFAVVRASGADWRIKDGPAISMRSIDADAKLARVLWIVRVDDGEVPGAPVLSWYYQELDGDLTQALTRARHLRPKGGKGTEKKGWYLRPEFFEFCGLMRSLNG